MKKILLMRATTMCLIILPFICLAQKQLTVKAIEAKLTVNFRTLSLHNNAAVILDAKQQPVLDKLNQRLKLSQQNFASPLLTKNINKFNHDIFEKPSANKAEAVITSPLPIASFKGSKEGANLYPPDPGGAAGPQYIMHVNNKEYIISNKTGNTVLSLPVDTFWSVFKKKTLAIGYPHVEYDPVLKHFYIATLGVIKSSNNYAVLFGTTATADPTGNWALYYIDLGPDYIQDAPQLGYSKRWFTITTQQYDTAAPNNFNSTGIYFMSRSDVVAGTLLNYFSISDPSFFSMSPVETQDDNITNHYLISNVGSSADTGYLYVTHIAGSLTAPTYDYDDYVTKALPWSETPVFGRQKGTANKIYLGNTKLTGAVYKNAQIWTSHTVYLPANNPKRAVAQWWEINAATLNVTQIGRVENKADTVFYAFPSIAVNKHKDVLLGYNQFSATTYPSAAYSYRNGTDAVNTLRKPRIYKKGLAAYFDGGASGVTYYWGDYTSTSIDPVDSSFWTVQEYAETPANKWGTWWAHVGDVAFAALNSIPAPIYNIQKFSVTISPNPAADIASISWIEEKVASVKIQISNAQGNILLTKEFNAQQGNNKITLNIANLVSGVYSVTIYNGTDVEKTQLAVE